MSVSYRLLRSKPFVVFSIIMLIKMYIVSIVIFGGEQLWKTLVTGLPSIWVLFCLIEWFTAKRKLTAYVTLNLLLTSILFAAVTYYKYYGVIVTYHALQQVNQVAEVNSSVFSLTNPFLLLIYLDIVALGILLLFNEKVRAWRHSHRIRERKKVVMFVFVISLALCLINIWPNRAVMNEIMQAEGMGILNYETYQIFAGLGNEPLDSTALTQADINKAKGIHNPDSVKYWNAAKGRNVIVIQMESFQSFLLDLKIEGQELTPVMNQLKRENVYFPHFYQQVGQGNTSDAEFIVNTSFYIPPNGAAAQTYGDRILPSLPRLFNRAGYQSLTFHTNDVSFWSRDQLYKALGFTKYYDRKFFGEGDMMFFGSSDEVLYAKTAEELANIQRSMTPFYAHVISMSAHHPYGIPEAKERITLPEQYADSLVGKYLVAQNYADYALGQFIKQLKASGVWDDSLIVIYGDHLGMAKYMLDQQDRKLMARLLDRDYEFPDMLNIPLIVAMPGKLDPQVIDRVGGQVDLLPTIANLMGFSLESQLHFGQDLFNQRSNLLPQRYYLPSGSFINNDAVFVSGEGFVDGTHYSIRKPAAYELNVSQSEYDRAQWLLNISNSYVSQLPKQ